MFLKPANNTEIKDYILDLNTNKACRYDEITPFFFQFIAFSLNSHIDCIG